MTGGMFTLVLGDVEASTEQWERDAEVMTTSMRSLNDLIDGLVAVHNGTRPVEQGEGDNFVAVFTRATEGVAFALALQQRLVGNDVQVRVGVHTGEVEVIDGSYSGPAIIRAARLRDAGHGGQILLSQTTADLVLDWIDADTTLDDLGVHQLKGLQRAERVWQLGHPELPSSFPALRLSGDTGTTKRHPTAFIGRDADMAHVRDLVKEPGCVTLTGAGGAGKTRLAIELIADGHRKSWFVDLAAVDNPDGVPTAVANAVGARVTTGRSPTEAVTALIGDQDALIVLDNCEHLLAPSSAIAAHLLSRCTNLTLLATSREPLGLEGEITYRLPSLAAVDAAALFVERARRANPHANLDSVAVIDQICERLDGMPLAIELAAARMRVFSAPQLLDALHDRFRLLTGGARTAMPRQRTLEASVDWSYALLLDAERTLLRRLSVFAGGFTTEAAVAVAPGGDLEAHHVLDLLVQLVEKSLITPDDQVAVRFHMLETIRHFAAARLVDEREVGDVRQRHYEYFTNYARRQRRAAGTPEDERFRALDGEYPNLRRALQWAADQAGYEPLLELMGYLYWFWRAGRYGADAAQWYDQLDAVTTDAPDHVRSLVFTRRAGFSAHDFALRDRLAAEGLRLARASGDDRTILACVVESTDSLMNFSGVDDDLLREVIDIAQRLDDQPRLAIAYYARGFHLTRSGLDPALGMELLEHSRGMAAALGLDRLARMAVEVLAMYRLLLDGELTLADRAIVQMRHRDDSVSNLANMLALTAAVRAGAGDNEGADRDLAELDELVATTDQFVAHMSQHIGYGLVSLMRADWESCLEHLTMFTALPTESSLAAPFATFAAIAEALAGRTDAAQARLAALALDATSLADMAAIGAALVQSVAAMERGDVERAFDIALAVLSDPTQPIALFGGLVATQLARATALLGRHEEAVRIAGSVVPTDDGIWGAILGDFVVTCRAALGDERYEALWVEGIDLGPTAAIALLLRGRGKRQRPVLGWDSLTPTESAVAQLVAQGASNKDVASRLLMSEATVKTHLTRVYAKVGVTSRTQLAAKAGRRSS